MNSSVLVSNLMLVEHHVSEPLVVDNPQEDIDLHLIPVDARVHGLGPVVRIARRAQLLTEEVHSAILFRGRRGGVVMFVFGVGLVWVVVGLV